MPKRSLPELVLDSIDLIKSRKSRPNLLRIYRHLHRLHDVDLQTCEDSIQNLLDEGLVIKVTYKGNISYRNALKWKKYNCHLKKNMFTKLSGSLLTQAISELVVEEPDYLNIGVPFDILEKHILSMERNLTSENIQKLIKLELKSENLCQYENGNYFIGPKPSNTFSLSNLEEKMESTQAKVILGSSGSENIDFPVGMKDSSSSGDNGAKVTVATHPRNNNYVVQQIAFVNGPVNDSVEKCDNVMKKSSAKSKIKRSQLNCRSIHTSLNRSLSSTEGRPEALSSMSPMDVANDGAPSCFEKIEFDDSTSNSIIEESESTIPTHSPTPPCEEEKEPLNSLALERGKRNKKVKLESDDWYYPPLKATRGKYKRAGENGARASEKARNARVSVKKALLPCAPGARLPAQKSVVFPPNVCSECKRCIGKKDGMMFCSMCNNFGHLLCVRKKMVGEKWFCVDCRLENPDNSKTCWVCVENQEKGSLYPCSVCKQLYHAACHVPVLSDPYSRSWRCSSCTSNSPLESNHIQDKTKDQSIKKTLDEEETAESSDGNSSKYLDIFEGEPPDSSRWTQKEVYEYFRIYFGEKIAKDIYEQDLDGDSLRLVDREDILGLHFNLGICLKILMHVRRLQLRTNDLRKIWGS